jgi:hypothetical protein
VVIALHACLCKFKRVAKDGRKAARQDAGPSLDGEGVAPPLTAISWGLAQGGQLVFDWFVQAKPCTRVGDHAKQRGG